MSESTIPVLLDNTVLSKFGLVNRAELVLQLWPGAVCTTLAALAEYHAGVAAGLLSAVAWQALPVVTLTNEEAAFTEHLSPRLGAGEQACLAVAIHRRGLLASDDQDARRTARHYQVAVTGTLGILILAVRRGLLGRTDANALPEEMVALGYRSPFSSLEPLLRNEVR